MAGLQNIHHPELFAELLTRSIVCCLAVKKNHALFLGTTTVVDLSYACALYL
jgi:hypothetical protein